jgi:alpha(1,3/1,4) fucosyltransferase
MKKTIRINFSDFDPGYDKTNNYFYHLLSNEYDVVIDEVNPQYHIYSCFGTEYLNYDCVRIFYTGENDMPDFNLCDYALSCHPIEFNDRHKRFPNFATYNQHQELLNRKAVTKEELSHRKFCNFIVSSTWADPIRDSFYQLLAAYKPIDSPGKVFHNIEMQTTNRGWHFDKLDFMQQYKFSITFENSSLPGYTTEKILHAFAAGTVPIYWGNPTIAKDFNSEAFINCHEYNSLESIVDRIKELDNDTEQYLQLLNAPVFANNNMPEFLADDYLLPFFRSIFQQPYDKAFRRTPYGFTGSYARTYQQRVKDAAAYATATGGLKGTIQLVKDQFKKRLF